MARQAPRISGGRFSRERGSCDPKQLTLAQLRVEELVHWSREGL